MLCAKEYKNYYVDYEYLIVSQAFVKNSYYIVSAHEDNYLHLTGVHTNLTASDFFDKCYTGTLKESDFDFFKNGQIEKTVKGSVRRKIANFAMIMSMFTSNTMVEEDFKKNRIKCTLAAANASVTLGFIVVGKARPMTLLKGNELDLNKSKQIDLVLRRRSGSSKFTDIIAGSIDVLREYEKVLLEILSDDLLLKVKEE
ncbi:MAG: hypothetical protein HUJ56_09320 [Erysipelotrichaceae bacterium]|nr:hypothetical protein [Erysipelotrichaceae bacterium]